MWPVAQECCTAVLGNVPDLELIHAACRGPGALPQCSAIQVSRRVMLKHSVAGVQASTHDSAAWPFSARPLGLFDRHGHAVAWLGFKEPLLEGSVPKRQVEVEPL